MWIVEHETKAGVARACVWLRTVCDSKSAARGGPGTERIPECGPAVVGNSASLERPLRTNREPGSSKC
jgi:hypothetical protein